jgi:hypothetical protein
MNKGLLAEKARLKGELEDIAKVQEEADESLAKAIRKAVSPYSRYVYDRFDYDSDLDESSKFSSSFHVHVGCCGSADLSVFFSSISFKTKKGAPFLSKSPVEIEMSIGSLSVLQLFNTQLEGREFYMGETGLQYPNLLSFNLPDNPEDLDLIIRGYLKIGTRDNTL